MQSLTKPARPMCAPWRRSLSERIMAFRSPAIGFLQLNCQRSNGVHDDLRGFLVDESGVDVVMVQEPYLYEDLSKTLKGYRRVLPPVAPGDDAKVATYVCESLTVLLLQQFSSQCMLTLAVTKGEVTIYVINVYFSPTSDIDRCLLALDGVLQGLPRRVIVAGDFNARSASWFSRSTDVRGRAVRDFILAANLEVCNVRSPLTTYCNTQGFGDNIDITLCSAEIDPRVTDWTIRDWSLSDHRAISFRFDGRVHPGGGQELGDDQRPFQTANADWPLLRRRLRVRVEISPVVESVGERAENLQQIITDILKEHLPVRSAGRASVAWWTPEVGEARRAFRRASKEHRTRPSPVTNGTLRTLRNRYVAVLRRAKRESWRRFITDLGNRDPYGFVYKHTAQRLPQAVILRSLRRPDGTMTLGVDDTHRLLLETFFPRDTLDDDLPEHAAVRMEASLPVATEMVATPTIEELDGIVKSLKLKKAPGHDRLTAEILKQIWSVIRVEMHHIIQVCYETGEYPEIWKIAKLCLVPKSGNRDLTNPKSLRPISLLPTLNKVMEKTILSRLLTWCREAGALNGRQYAFLPGKSTVDLLLDMREMVEGSPFRYCLVLALDVESAFDMAWWPAVFQAFRRKGCPANLFSLLQHYLAGREVRLIEKSGRWQGLQCERGCPQGSNLGPIIWNILIDGVFDVELPAGVQILAYADDVFLVVPGNTRVMLEDTSCEAVDELLRWCEQRKLKISPAKCQAVLVKGNLNLNRPPIIRCAAGRIPVLRSVKILGVSVDAGFKFVTHVSRVTDRAVSLFGRLRRVSRANFGLDFRSLRLLYLAVFVGMVQYGCAVWSSAITAHQKRKLLSAQRTALLVVTKAYRTCSGVCLPVIAGTMPLDLLLEQRSRRYLIKRERVPFRAEREVRADFLQRWQAEWTASDRGGHTRALIPDIARRLRFKGFTTDHYFTQFLTGHGQFSARLASMGLRQFRRCLDCGHEEDDAFHAVFGCVELLMDWVKLRRDLRLGAGPLDLPRLLCSARGAAVLQDHVRRVLRAREELHNMFLQSV